MAIETVFGTSFIIATNACFSHSTNNFPSDVVSDTIMTSMTANAASYSYCPIAACLGRSHFSLTAQGIFRPAWGIAEGDLKGPPRKISSIPSSATAYGHNVKAAQTRLLAGRAVRCAIGNMATIVASIAANGHSRSLQGVIVCFASIATNAGY